MASKIASVVGLINSSTESIDKAKAREKNNESLLILEKSFEKSGQQWLDNVNVIEQFLVKVVEIISKNHPELKARFVVRRLPLYTSSLCNTNEYGIVLDNIDFTLLPPRRSSAVEYQDKPPVAQVEIFHRKMAPGVDNGNCHDDFGEILNEDGAYRSVEVFKQYASAFIRASTLEPGEETPPISHQPPPTFNSIPYITKPQVQLLTPHLVHEMTCNPDIAKIFTLTPQAFSEAEEKLCKERRPRYADCKVGINYLTSTITLSLEDTQVVVRPCVFYSKGYNRINSNLLDRLALFHPNIVQICEGLSKGSLLFPTNFDTLWSLQLWPCESHLLSMYHPSSIVCRLFKLFATYCLNPSHFWETMNNCFLIGLEDDLDEEASVSSTNIVARNKGQLLNVDFLVSTFLHEMENCPDILDWTGSNFYERFMSLVNASVESMDRGFHPHYFTGLNALQPLVRGSNFGRDERFALKALDEIDEEEDDDNTTVTAEQSNDYLDQDHDIDEEDFGLSFEHLEINEDHQEVFTDGKVKKYATAYDAIYRAGHGTVSSLHGVPGASGGGKKRSSYDTNLGHLGGKKKSKTLSKMFGSNLMKKFSTLNRSRSDVNGEEISNRIGLRKSMKTEQSLDDITSGFVESLSHSRREECQKLEYSETTFVEEPTTFNERGVDIEFPQPPPPPIKPPRNRGRSKSQPSVLKPIDSLKRHAKFASEEDFASIASSTVAWRRKVESIYSNILSILKDIPPSDYLCDTEFTQELGVVTRNLQVQEELAKEWTQTLLDFPAPKTICPHAFNSRQIQYISKVIQTTSKCLPSAMIPLSANRNTNERAKITAWEISGDLLRVVLHQLRSEPAIHEALRLKQDKSVGKKLSLKAFKNFVKSSERTRANENRRLSSSQQPLEQQPSEPSCHSFNFKRRHSAVCTGHLRDVEEGDGGIGTDLSEIQFAMEEPEAAATMRLLQWLWQLRTSGIGRLSFRAKRYLEHLHQVSHVNSFFLEQWTEEKVLRSMAIKSALAVSRIMSDPKVPAYVPLAAASKKGWQWAEMILSLASWNKEKGFPIQAHVAEVASSETGGLLRDISISSGAVSATLSRPSKNNAEADFEVLTLAYHSESPIPLGWNEFEDPRKPGPHTVPILILSSMLYFKQWEMIPGNIVQVMIRLQRFNNLEHVASMLQNPYRKTAMTEVRKLNKCLSFRVDQFDNTVMSKTFKRLASLRSTKKRLRNIYNSTTDKGDQCRLYSCHDLGCQRGIDNQTFETEVECTRL